MNVREESWVEPDTLLLVYMNGRNRNVNNMYKSYKISKRFGIAFNKFRKSAKGVSKVYNTGFHKWTDEINEFTTYSITVGVYRVMLYVQHKHKCGVTNG